MANDNKDFLSIEVEGNNAKMNWDWKKFKDSILGSFGLKGNVPPSTEPKQKPVPVEQLFAEVEAEKVTAVVVEEKVAVAKKTPATKKVTPKKAPAKAPKKPVEKKAAVVPAPKKPVEKKATAPKKAVPKKSVKNVK